MKMIASHAVLGLLVCIGTVVVMRSQQATSQRFPQFGNEDVKVWRSIVYPDAPLTMHRHHHPRVIIAIKGGTMKIVEKSGNPRRARVGARVGNSARLLASRKSSRHATCQCKRG